MKQRGISLIESLVAMVIMSVGLLGVVALQTNSLSQQRSAYLETQATNMAQDMMDRIRANRDQANAYNIDFCENSSGTGLVASDTSTWMRDLEDVLPGGEGKVEVNDQITVTVRFTPSLLNGKRTNGSDCQEKSDKRTIDLVTEL